MKLNEKLSNLRAHLPAVIMPMAAVILELLPGGVPMTFSPSPTERVVKTFPYFSAMPWAYGNFFPILTAVLTVFMVIFAVHGVANRCGTCKKILTVLSLLALLFSVLTLIFAGFTLIGGAVSLALLAELLLAVRLPFGGKK